VFSKNKMVIVGKVLGAATKLWALDDSGAVAMTMDIQTSG